MPLKSLYLPRTSLDLYLAEHYSSYNNLAEILFRCLQSDPCYRVLRVNKEIQEATLRSIHFATQTAPTSQTTLDLGQQNSNDENLNVRDDIPGASVGANGAVKSSGSTVPGVDGTVSAATTALATAAAAARALSSMSQKNDPYVNSPEFWSNEVIDQTISIDGQGSESKVMKADLHRLNQTQDIYRASLLPQSNDSDDCEEDCEFSLDDDSGDGADSGADKQSEYSIFDPYSMKGIRPDEPGYDKEAEYIADHSRSQMADLTKKMELQRQLAVAVHQGRNLNDHEARVATENAMQSTMNAAAMMQMAIAESERASVQKAAFSRLAEPRQFEFNNLVSRLSDYRSQRLSQESFPLPPTHFFILGTLGSLVALSFALLSPPTSFITHSATAQRNILGGVLSFIIGNGDVARQIPVFSSTSRLIFALLVACISLVIDFSLDLNVPFGGIYQVRRSVPTAMLLQVRRAILEALPEKEQESLVASDDLSVRLSVFKQKKYPVAAMLLGSDNAEST